MRRRDTVPYVRGEAPVQRGFPFPQIPTEWFIVPILQEIFPLRIKTLMKQKKGIKSELTKRIKNL